MKIVATTSLPAVDRPNADRWNAARSCQWFMFHYVQAEHINVIALKWVAAESCIQLI